MIGKQPARRGRGIVGRRRGTHGRSAAQEEPRALEGVTIYLSDQTLACWTDAAGQRLSDLLNAQHSLSVVDSPAAPQVADEWVSVDGDAVLLVAPPPHPGNATLRVHRRLVRVQIEIGDYLVDGVAHLPPGGGLDTYQLHLRPPFLTLTDATVRNTALGLEDHLPVVIVNIGSAGQLHRLETD